MIGIIDYLMILGTIAPALVLWIAVIIFAVIMLRRGGGRAERFMIAGAGIKIVSNLLRIPMVFIVPWLIDRGYSSDYAISVSTGYGIFLNVIGMAGIICLVYAFWVKFKTRSLEGIDTKISANLERGTHDTIPEY